MYLSLLGAVLVGEKVECDSVRSRLFLGALGRRQLHLVIDLQSMELVKRHTLIGFRFILKKKDHHGHWARLIGL